MLKGLLKSALRRLGLRVSRTPAHRFDALDDTLRDLRRRGFRPALIVDGGANRGQWARRALTHFGDTPIVLVEPQAACQEHLRGLQRQFPCASIATVALTSPGVEAVWMDAAAWDIGSTGARVFPAPHPEGRAVRVPATTLDELLACTTPTASVRPLFLKLDLEGHEVEALKGALVTMSRTEVILSETRLLGGRIETAQDFEELIDWVRGHGFALYDFVSLSGRPGDGRLRLLDVLFVRRGGMLDGERHWEAEEANGQ